MEQLIQISQQTAEALHDTNHGLIHLQEAAQHLQGTAKKQPLSFRVAV